MHALHGSYEPTRVHCPHCGGEQGAVSPPTLAPGYNGIAQRCGYRICRRPFVVLVQLVLRPRAHAVYLGARAMEAWSRPALSDALADYRDGEGKPLLTSHDLEYNATVFELTRQPWQTRVAA